MERRNPSNRRRNRNRQTRRSDYIVEKKSEKNGYVEHRYLRKKLLGKGGFAKVYRVEDVATRKKYALKMVEKKSLKRKNREKLSTEIKIHSSLDHPYICRFIRFFEDRMYVYLLLELCECETLMEILALRKRLSEREVKYFMYQLIVSMIHMHDRRIIHRDLKLGNIFLSDQLDIKVGDFGLAAQLKYDGQRKRTLCGTPNYLAPEILMNARNGHSYEVDVWSIGVILFTLLTGKPPFETRTVKETYRNIKRIHYDFPRHIRVSREAKEIIQVILQKDPIKRPTIYEILEYDFFKEYKNIQNKEDKKILEVPSRLKDYVYRRTNAYPLPKDKVVVPSSSVSDEIVQLRIKDFTKRRSPTGIDNYLKKEGCLLKPVPHTPPPKSRVRRKYVSKKVSTRNQPNKENLLHTKKEVEDAKNGYNSWLYKKLEKSLIVNKKKKMKKKKKKMMKVAKRKEPVVVAPEPVAVPRRTPPVVVEEPPVVEEEDEGEVPEVLPVEKEKGPRIWVEDFADYSNKYGMAYRYNTGIVGAFYNDFTMMLYNPSTGKIKYFTRRVSREKKKTFSMEEYFVYNYPMHMKKKITLIKYFHCHFEKTKGSMLVLDYNFGDIQDPIDDKKDQEMSDVFVKMYLKTKDALVFRLSNRIVQVRFTDNSEIILSSEAKMVTYLSKYGIRKTFPLESILEKNPDPSISKRLRYTKNILHRLIQRN